MDYNSVMAPGLYNTAYNPYAVNWGQSEPQTTTPAISFGNQLQCDTYEKPGMSTGAKVATGLGIAAAIAGVCLFHEKIPIVRDWKIWQAAAEGGAKASEGAMNDAKNIVNRYILPEQQARFDFLRGERNKAYESAKVALGDLKLTDTQLEALKECTSAGTANSKATEATTVIGKIRSFFEGPSAEDIANKAKLDKILSNAESTKSLTNWADKTVTYNSARKEVRDAAKEIAKQLDAKTLRNQDLTNIEGGRLERFLKANPEEAKAIYKLADEGKADEAATKINNLISKTRYSEFGSKQFAKADLEAWAKSSKGAVGVNPNVIAENMKIELAKQADALEKATISWDTATMDKFKEVYAKTGSVKEALIATRDANKAYTAIPAPEVNSKGKLIDNTKFEQLVKTIENALKPVTVA